MEVRSSSSSKTGMARIAEIASCIGIPPPVQTSKLGSPPSCLPIQDTHIELAEEYLDNRRFDSSAATPPSKLLRLKRHKAPARTPEEVFNALDAIVKQRGSAEIARALIHVLQTLGGDLNVVPPPKQSFAKSLTKRLSKTKLEPINSQLLQIATTSGQLEMMHVLASYSESCTLNSCLCIAITNDDLAATELLLRYGADANSVEDQFPLWKAVQEKNLERVRLLLKASKPPCGKCLSKALLKAVDIKDVQLVMELLAKGAEYSYRDFSSLTIAVELSSLEITVALLASGGKLPPPRTLDSVISKAFLIQEKMTHQRWYQLLEILLCAGAQGNATNQCLIQAVMLNSVEITKLFVSYGASVSHDSAKALQHAVSIPNLDIITLLLGANSPPPPSYVSAAVTTAMKLGDSVLRLQVVKLLHRAGATGAELNKALTTVASQTSIEQPDVLLLDLLLEMNADVNHENGQAIEIATTRGNLGVLERLLNAGPSMNTLCRAYTAAWKVSLASRQNVIMLLFHAGTPINDQVNSSLVTLVNSNPLDHELIKFLLEKGAQAFFNQGRCLVDSGLALNIQTFQLLTASVPNSSSDIFSSVLLGVFCQSEINVWVQEGLQIMKLLLKRRVRASTLNDVLVFSIESAHLRKRKGGNKNSKTMEFVGLLLENGANRNHKSGLALQKAAQYGMLDIVALLFGEECSALTLNMAFPYLFASETLIPEDFVLHLIALLRANGKAVDKDFNHPTLGSTIILALRRYPESDSLLRALLDLGVQVDQVIVPADGEFKFDGMLITPLTWIAAQPSSPRQMILTRTLLEFGANANFYTDKSSTTPLLLATKAKNHELMKILLEAGADASIVDTSDTSIIWYATNNDDKLAIDILLQASAIPNDGSLHEASLRMNLEIIDSLYNGRHKVDFPCPHYDGRTPLEEVCLNAASTSNYLPGQERSLECTMKKLVTLGANLKRRHLGKSLLFIALDGANPFPSVKVLLRTFMYEHINDDFNLYTENELTYSPTMYVKKGLCKAPKHTHSSLIKLLRGSTGIDVFYSENVLLPQPDDMINAPPHITAARAKRFADTMAEEKRKKHVLVLREEETLAAAHAAELANEKFLQTKKHQEYLAKAKEKLEAKARERRMIAEKEEKEAFQLREEREMRLQREALENSKRVEMVNAMIAKANRKAQQELIDEEMKHQLHLHKMNHERAEELRSLLVEEQRILDSIKKHIVNLEKTCEETLLKERIMMEKKERKWAQQEQLSVQQEARMEGQLYQQRAIVRDMERAKEQLYSLQAGGGLRRYSNFTDESQ